tara:strand:- start:500 stop:1555 length:1056 start_codon:yes stop_codon:yes gene_type:complete
MNTDPQLIDATRRIYTELGSPWPPTEKRNNKLWKTLEDSGLTLAWCPEALGGAGGSVGDGLTIIGITGEFWDPAPVTETLLAGWLLSKAAITIPKGPLSLLVSQPASKIKVDENGKISGRAEKVPFAASSKHLAALVEPPSGTGHQVAILKTADASILPGHNVAAEPRDSVSLSEVEPLALVDPLPALNPSSVLLLGALARSIQMTHAISAVLNMCIEYAQQRPAFGRPISKFQSIQHYLAVIAGEYASALAITAAAEESFIQDSQIGKTNIISLASAKVRVGEAANRVCALSHQIHGAMGFTEEYTLHLFTHRLWSWRNDFGNEATWATEIGKLVAKLGPEGLWHKLTTY